MQVNASRMTGLGAGALYYAQDTGRFLMGLRGKGDMPNTWCCFGGGIEDNESVREGIFRELQEEAGVQLECPLFLVYTCVETNFSYENYVGIVPHEFECKLNPEHTKYSWFAGNEFPLELHPKFRTALASPDAQALLLSLKHV